MEKNIIHLHNILELLSEKDYSKSKLLEKIEKEFGEDVKFTNCSGLTFDFEEVLDFMIGKGKISIDENDNVGLDSGCGCSNK